MVKLNEVQAANTTLVKSHPLVSVFIGGTSGIGDYTVRGLAKLHNTQGCGLQAYIVGRNEKAARETIEECLRVCPRGHFEFIKSDDLALIKDVDVVSKEIARLVQERQSGSGAARIDLLVMTQGQVIFGGRQETTEGLDRTMSLIYYSRMRFILKLLPLLQAATSTAHIISVYAGGLEGPLFQDDLSFRSPLHYSSANARSHITWMTTMFFERVAQPHWSKLSLIHVYPGLVVTPAFHNDRHHPLWWKVARRTILPLVVW